MTGLALVSLTAGTLPKFAYMSVLAVDTEEAFGKTRFSDFG